MIEIGLGPLGARRVGAVSALETRHLVAHEVGGLVGHELEIARPARRDDRLAERHRLGHRQPEALAAVQRRVAVAGGHHAAALLGRDVAVDEDDVGPARRGGAQQLELVEARLAVDALEHECGAVVRAERAPVGLDQPERILALDAAEEVEHEEEEEALGQAELLARETATGEGTRIGTGIVSTGLSVTGAISERT